MKANVVPQMQGIGQSIRRCFPSSGQAGQKGFGAGIAVYERVINLPKDHAGFRQLGDMRIQDREIRGQGVPGAAAVQLAGNDASVARATRELYGHTDSQNDRT